MRKRHKGTNKEKGDRVRPQKTGAEQKTRKLVRGRARQGGGESSTGGEEKKAKAKLSDTP